MVYILASGRNIDAERVEPFSKQLDRIYENPFKTNADKNLQTADEIKDHIMGKINEKLQELGE